MSRHSFSDDEFSSSITLQNVSANLKTIKRLQGWSTMEMSRHVGVTDRHLDSLLKMTSNVTVLILEKIAEGLGVPFLRLVGTRIVANAHHSGKDFLEDLRKEEWSISSKDLPALTRRSVTDPVSRESSKSVKAPELVADEAPAGIERILSRIIDVQDQLTKDQSETSAKVDKLFDQMQDLMRTMTGKSRPAASSDMGARHGQKGSRKAASADEDSAFDRKNGRRAARSTTGGTTASKISAGARSQHTEEDLFDHSASAPSAPRQGRRELAHGAGQATRKAALKYRDQDPVKTGSSKGSRASKRAYNTKKSK